MSGLSGASTNLAGTAFYFCLCATDPRSLPVFLFYCLHYSDCLADVRMPQMVRLWYPTVNGDAAAVGKASTKYLRCQGSS